MERRRRKTSLSRKTRTTSCPPPRAPFSSCSFAYSCIVHTGQGFRFRPPGEKKTTVCPLSPPTPSLHSFAPSLSLAEKDVSFRKGLLRSRWDALESRACALSSRVCALSSRVCALSSEYKLCTDACVFASKSRAEARPGALSLGRGQVIGTDRYRSKLDLVQKC